MRSNISYTEAQAKLATLWDHIIENREAVVIHRRGKEDVVVLPASALRNVEETAHLLRSPKNAERLLTALARARAGTEHLQTIEALKREIGFGKEA